ncbi:50S ribosomal protein L13 [Candidatus Woesearchaeota archaeon]|nr:50S ribosomal protein L13 [Candidatus Woesearchaeota archaeon]
MIINGQDLILGRLVSYVAKQAMRGENVDIVNCENVVIVGKKEMIMNEYKEREEIGSVSKGPFYPKMPDRFVRRVVRGMLPYKESRGKAAFERVMCYLGVPDQFKDKKLESVQSAHIENKRTSFITIGELSRIMWGKQV